MRGLRSCVAVIVCALAAPGVATAQTATQDINISATVPKSCTINNTSTGTVDTATIPISAGGSVNTSPVTPVHSPYANIACNAPSNLQLTSLNGGVTNGTSATGFQNFINYTASAVWHGVTATVATASSSGTGPVSGTAQSVSTAFSGSMSVTITPAANTLPLVQGSYSDTLRITLTPQ
jgi:hypothetical protein